MGKANFLGTPLRVLRRETIEGSIGSVDQFETVDHAQLLNSRGGCMRGDEVISRDHELSTIFGSV